MTTPDLAWSVTVTVRHDSSWSKNRMWLARAGTHARRLNPEARERRDRLASLLGRQIQPTMVHRNVLSLTIHVVKADHRSDSINVLDLVADAVELATGLNDRWYALAGLTWSLDPSDPRIVVTVSQANIPDVVACSACGLLLPPEDFPGKPIDQGVCRVCAKKKRAYGVQHKSPPCPEPDPSAGNPPPW